MHSFAHTFFIIVKRKWSQSLMIPYSAWLWHTMRRNFLLHMDFSYSHLSARNATPMILICDDRGGAVTFRSSDTFPFFRQMITKGRRSTVLKIKFSQYVPEGKDIWIRKRIFKPSFQFRAEGAKIMTLNFILEEHPLNKKYVIFLSPSWTVS